jgi:hypothetical protein
MIQYVIQQIARWITNNQLLFKETCKKEVRNKLFSLILQFVGSNAVSALEGFLVLFNAYTRTDGQSIFDINAAVVRPRLKSFDWIAQFVNAKPTDVPTAIAKYSNASLQHLQ